jgi:hypothetical protein
MKLNGIQRIGIVLSIIAFIGLGAFAWVVDGNYRTEPYRSELDRCYRSLSVNNEALDYIEKLDEREKRKSADWAKYEKCRDDAKPLFYARADPSRNGFQILLAVGFGLIVFVWLVAWFLLGIGRWIRRGFA